MITVLLAGFVVLLVACILAWRSSSAWPLLGYAAVVLALDLGSHGVMNSKARLLLPAFVLLIPAAISLARRRSAVVALAITTMAAFSAWFGSYALTVWPYAI